MNINMAANPAMIPLSDANPTMAAMANPNMAMAQMGQMNPAMAQMGQMNPAMAQMGQMNPTMAQVGQMNPAMAQMGQMNPAMAQMGQMNPAMAQKGQMNPAMAQMGQMNPAMAQMGQMNPAMAQMGQMNPAMAQIANANPAMAQMANANPAMAQMANANSAMAQMANANAAMPPMEFYFYTSETNMQEITLFGTIKSTPLLSTDAGYGEGVYGTPIPPNRAQEVLALNAWGSYWSQHLEAGQDIDRAIQLQIPADKLTMSTTNPNVFIHLDCIDVNAYTWQVWDLAEGLSKAAQPQQVVVEEDGNSSDSSDSDGEDQGADSSDDCSDDSDEDQRQTAAGPEWEGWPVNNTWGRQPVPQPAMYDPYGMFGGYGAVEYEESSDSSSDEGW